MAVHRRLRAWRRRNLLRSAKMFELHPWRYGLEVGGGCAVVAFVIQAPIAGALSGVIAGFGVGVFIALFLRFIMGPRWKRRAALVDTSG